MRQLQVVVVDCSVVFGDFTVYSSLSKSVPGVYLGFYTIMEIAFSVQKTTFKNRRNYRQ